MRSEKTTANLINSMWIKMLKSHLSEKNPQNRIKSKYFHKTEKSAFFTLKTALKFPIYRTNATFLSDKNTNEGCFSAWQQTSDSAQLEK